MMPPGATFPGADAASAEQGLASTADGGGDAPTAERYPEEWRRLGSLYAREGAAATVDFCRRTMPIYRGALLSGRRGGGHGSFATLPEYRSRFIRSYCEFKRFARAHRPALSPAPPSGPP
jgi:hypothetical protein